ncbi:MAG: hypothetical protein ACD_39C00479G0002 [uncultured bacterium]|nr:MAG: hypothetical protein ACD_39C00479G0002 [uncultured bacterium]
MLTASKNKNARKTQRSVCWLLLALLLLVAGAAEAYDPAGYEVYSIADYKSPTITRDRTVLKPSPRNAINSDGMGGFFVSNTADLFDPEQLILSSRYKYHELTSTRGMGLHSSEEGSVSTFESSLTWIGKWAEWAVTIPLHDWDLSAPRTFGGYAESNTGLGNMRLGWKATYLPDKSYYRFAYGAMMGITTGNPAHMLPAGSKNSDELKLFGCVTTSETDRATANLELGAVIDSESDDNSFQYRLAMSYEATEHVSLIGEVVGDVLGGDDKDTMDLVMGIRVQPTTVWTLEFVYYKNLRTYRDYGWDEQLQAGYTLRW